MVIQDVVEVVVTTNVLRNAVGVERTSSKSAIAIVDIDGMAGIQLE